MPKHFIFLIIGLFFGFGAGVLFSGTMGWQMQQHDDGTHDHGDTSN